tara:strand:+ start:71 stop:463 length:393 start_codon:yes stop_codon:yes gene_type:complete
MGADFTLAKTPVFRMTEDRKKVLTEELSNLTQQDYENLRGELFWDDESDTEIQEACLDAIEQVMNLGEPRDCCTDWEYNENGERMMFLYTGGMSWGDSPTDNYDLVSSLYYVPVADTIERFAVEDCKVEA